MISLQFKYSAFYALIFAVFTAPVFATPASPAPQKNGYVSFDGFTKVTNKDSLAWYRRSSLSIAKAVVENPPGYECFHGANYPGVNDWESFGTLWNINLPALRLHNSAANNQILRSKILSIATETNTDARIILAIIMQESSGQLDVYCTGENKHNCGIMQAAPGSVSFDPKKPAKSIDTMLRNGVLGTPGSWPNGGPGYAWFLNGANGEAWANMGGGGYPFRAMRAYNTGKVPDQKNYDATNGFGTVSYVNDVANRLLGWNGNGRGCGY
ncbi:hypothetical protein DIS24_g836 [Lasiodiplodia hormozganensis]|uniref:Transglycosylase SLT domain-containing protein n=1 Tax=Lasiodiplodia hormozganensis TaxID=869390 RepID=A0AA39Z560_9PEZI|nr:hypothetical protein DIS24_g836 [Lasiodiplodia hormozganensis]